MYLEEGDEVNSKNIIKEEEEYNNSKVSDNLNQVDEYKHKSSKNNESKRNSKNENIFQKFNENKKEEKKEFNKDIFNNINEKSKNLNASIKDENISQEIIKTKIDLKINRNRAKSSNITSSNTINKDNNVQIINVNNIKSNYNSIENSDKNKSKTISNSKQTGNNCAKTVIMKHHLKLIHLFMIQFAQS